MERRGVKRLLDYSDVLMMITGLACVVTAVVVLFGSAWALLTIGILLMAAALVT